VIGVQQDAARGDIPRVLTVDELATLLRVNRKTIYQLIAEGKLPGVRRLGRAIRADRDVVLHWLAGNAVSRADRGGPR
jgi:excisionase family DNA binding protein